VPLALGHEAPLFDLPASGGRRVKLADYRGKKNVVLYFYPRDFTPVCTKEACGFRDAYEDLIASDTEVIGVSVDGDGSHEKFAEKFGLPFPLVSDPSRELATKYGCVGILSKLLGRTNRVTFVIDKEGRIASVLESELSASHHVEGVRRAVDALRRKTPQ
jgi:peroxiredoxin Q/BCP